MTIRSPTASSTRSASCVSWSGPRRRPSVRYVNSRSRASSTTCDPSRITTSRSHYLRADELTSDATRRFRYRTTLTTGVRHRQELHELRHRLLQKRPSRARHAAWTVRADRAGGDVRVPAADQRDWDEG